MSLSDVTARIAVIQAQLASGAPRVPVPVPAALASSTGSGSPGSASPGTTAADFATTLGLAQASIDPTTGGALDPTSAALDPAAAALGPAGTGLPSGGATGADIAAAATRYVGVPYVAGGRSPATGWDCAGFTQYVARGLGIDLPDVSWEQIRAGTPVASLAQAQPGDLLFFHEPGGHLHDPSPLKVNHVAIYLGGGQVVEAASPQAGTRVGPVDAAHLVGIRRIAGGSGAMPLALSPAGLSASVLSSSALAPTTPTSAPAAPGGPALAPLQLVDVLRRAGFTGDGLRTAWAVAMRESSGTPGAVGAVNPNGTRDHGLFQINDVHLGTLIDPAQVYDASANAAAAYTLSKGGTDWSAWGLGGTGWAQHLAVTAPDVYRQFNERFQYWYARYPAV